MAYLSKNIAQGLQEFLHKHFNGDLLLRCDGDFYEVYDIVNKSTVTYCFGRDFKFEHQILEQIFGGLDK